MANIYVDQSATFNGDGTSAAQAGSPGGVGAFNTFASVSPGASDFVWIRRTAATVALTAGVTLGVAGVAYVGWPVVGDPDYAARPASGTSAGWDADGATYAELKCSTQLTVAYIIITGAGTRVERIKPNVNFQYITSQRGILDVRANCSINNSHLYNGNLVTGTVVTNGLMNTTNAVVCKVSNTTIEFAGQFAGTGIISGIRFDVNNSDFEFINTAVTFSNAAATNPSLKCVHFNTSSMTLRLSWAGCSFTRLSTACTATCVDFANGAVQASITMYDCDFDDRSVSSTASIMQTPLASVGTEGNRFIAMRLRALRGCKVIISAPGQYVHFETFTQTVVSTTYAVIFQSGGSVFACNNFTEFTGNTLGAIDGQKTNRILLQNATFISANPFGVVATILADIWIADVGGVYGAWQYRSAYGQVSAESVVRTGGETFALKFDTQSGSQNHLGRLQPMLYGLETIFAELSPTTTKITIYGAYKGYAISPDATQIWADCDYLDEASGAHRAFASSRGDPGDALISDLSGWSGDAGVTAFRLEMDVVPGQACLAPIRVHANLREASAYFYIDPKPVVT